MTCIDRSTQFILWQVTARYAWLTFIPVSHISIHCYLAVFDVIACSLDLFFALFQICAFGLLYGLLTGF